ncbi:DMT family transporter [Flavobacterium pectinovorum]|uniref:EamA family transporter n=1 Tax=Flavobacterium pectinovorum TaxID=29533 RepID=A0A502ER10_9FLAO|nr:DMT family transporter [Flavobacterium pectinovorum]TPG39937.1 EamA family transporter [Flavobacterium pectinovorum]
MKNSYLKLHIAVILSGFTGIFGKLISLNEGLLVWYRTFFSAIILFFLLKLTQTSVAITIREKLKISRSGIFIAIHWVFFYASIKYSNISIGVVCYCLTSFFTAIFDPLLNRNKFVFSQFIFSGITLLGISLIFKFDSSYHTGIMLGCISSAFAALYTIYNERLVKTYDSKVINYYQMTGGTISLTILLPFYLFLFPVNSLIPNERDFFYLLLLSSFCTVALYVLFAEALKKTPAYTTNLTFNLEPIYAIILAFIFFNEGKEMGKPFYVGLFFVFASVILQTIISFNKKK